MFITIIYLNLTVFLNLFYSLCRSHMTWKCAQTNTVMLKRFFIFFNAVLEPLNFQDSCYKPWKKKGKWNIEIFQEVLGKHKTLIKKKKKATFSLFSSVSDGNWILFGPPSVLREACWSEQPRRCAVGCVKENAQAGDSRMETEPPVTALALSHFPAVIQSLLPVVSLCTCMLIAWTPLAVVCCPLLVCHRRALSN